MSNEQNRCSGLTARGLKFRPNLLIEKYSSLSRHDSKVGWTFQSSISCWWNFLRRFHLSLALLLFLDLKSPEYVNLNFIQIFLCALQKIVLR